MAIENNFEKSRSKINAYSIAVFVLWVGIAVFVLSIYLFLSSQKIQFDIVSLTPIIGALMVILAAITLRNLDNRNRLNLGLARGEILKIVRKENYVEKWLLYEMFNIKISKKIFEAALIQLQSENIIMVDKLSIIFSIDSNLIENEKDNSLNPDLDFVKVIDNSNLDKFKYQLALTISELEKEISLGEDLRNQVEEFLRTPFKYSMNDATNLLGEIRSFITKKHRTSP